MKSSVRSAFTLIELLIVVAILSILVGAVTPYALRYVEDSRISKVKSDLEEIRNALVRWETERNPWVDADTTLANLVGPYLSKSPTDPWGQPYAISNQKSRIISYGPNRVLDGGDDIYLAFRPRMSIARILFKDNNLDGLQSLGDQIFFYCTRPVNTVNDGLSITFQNDGGGTYDGSVVFGPAPIVGKVIGNLVILDLTDPTGWPGGFTLLPGGQVEVVQIAGQEFINDFSGEVTQWAKEDKRLVFKYRDM